MFFKKILLLLTLVPVAFFASEPVEKSVPKKVVSYFDYQKSPHISDEVWERVKPYFLPFGLPARQKLDEIFKKKGVLTNRVTVQKAGFPKSKQRTYSHCTVSAHPYLPGYIVKMYTEEVSDVVDYEQWIGRIEGARSIQQTIDNKGYGRMFKVPRKWIYPLPASSVEAPNGKNFVLIAEDMRIYSNERNKAKWKSKLMDKKRVEAMFIIMKENGLADSIYPFNIPFCKDGTQAFIDTEYHHCWPIHYERMYPYFSPKAAEYWQQLVVNGSLN